MTKVDIHREVRIQSAIDSFQFGQRHLYGTKTGVALKCPCIRIGHSDTMFSMICFEAWFRFSDICCIAQKICAALPVLVLSRATSFDSHLSLGITSLVRFPMQFLTGGISASRYMQYIYHIWVNIFLPVEETSSMLALESQGGQFRRPHTEHFPYLN